jgi:hypothetical protein
MSMRTLLLAIGLGLLTLPALACGMNKTVQDTQQTPLPVASTDQTPTAPGAPADPKPQG